MNDLRDLHRAYQREYARLVEAVSQAVDRADPIGENAQDVRTILHEEFVRWFGDAGPIESCQTAADEVWRAVLEYRSTRS